MNVLSYNRKAWDQRVAAGDEFTRPASPKTIAAARKGRLEITLTRKKQVPAAWFPALVNKAVLCLGAGGGQQGPVLAAAGAQVTVVDNSPRQLEQDRYVARRDLLELNTVLADMSDLSMFPGKNFDLVFHPISNLFVPDVRPIWQEIFRVLRPGGLLLAGFMNPVFYIFDRQKMDEEKTLVVRHKLPYADISSLSETELEQIYSEGWPLEFSHTLTDQIGGQIEAGFIITGLYEDIDDRSPLSNFMPVYIATRAIKSVEI